MLLHVRTSFFEITYETMRDLIVTLTPSGTASSSRLWMYFIAVELFEEFASNDFDEVDLCAKFKIDC